MVELALKIDHNFNYRQDVEAIIEAVKLEGFILSYHTAKGAWDQYSDQMCAGWMMLPDTPAEIFRCIQPFLEERQE